jgi:hypothetical protein
MPEATITERVAAGAAFLDEHDPDWWRADVERAIDLDRLDMGDGDSCILGQRCPLSVLAEFVGSTPNNLDGSDFDSAYTAMAIHVGAVTDALPSHRPGVRVDMWAMPLGFQAASTGDGTFFDQDDYDALADEWKRVITGRRAA